MLLLGGLMEQLFHLVRSGFVFKKAINAQLSKTLMAISELLFPFAIFHQHFHRPAAFQRTAQTLDIRPGDRLDQDALRRGLNVSPRAFRDFKLFSEPKRNDHLPFH